ncbi:MAG: hypothetical protein Q4F41_19610 [Eubacteriales bacterium]|nr:hypothetical protein [Eubacteriales bacterium]
MTKKESIAKLIRTLSIPPVLVTAMLCILATVKPSYFHSPAEILTCILLLGIVPVLAYPLQKILPGLKEMGREGQRNLAFLLNLIGYAAAFLWALLEKASDELLLICSTYALSVVLLTICNKALHFRASGHACSFTGPLLLLVYFLGWKMAVPCVLVAALVIWSSLVLKRHTKQELTGGILVCAVSFLLSLALVSILR